MASTTHRRGGKSAGTNSKSRGNGAARGRRAAPAEPREPAGDWRMPETRPAVDRPRAAERQPTTRYSYCSLPPVPPREFSPDVRGRRLELIVGNAQKWVNGTVLHYYFFDRPTDGETVTLSDGRREFRKWATSDAEMQVVRKAFKAWADVGIGLKFEEVDAREDAEVRIGFMRGDGAWSYVGKDVRDEGPDQRTMNFGWDLTRHPGEIDTAIHEIGHTLGFPHEHQNPYAGIVWDEDAVYAALAGPPNFWDRAKTYHNIIRKISPDAVQGSNWDPDSVMHYPFEPGMIKAPPGYQNGLTPAGGISERDRTWVRTFYPPLTTADYTELKPFQSVPFSIPAGKQVNFTINPSATRYYEMRTFGEADTVMVLFEGEPGGQTRYITGDDDSGEDRNAHIRIKLVKGRKYVLRVRLYYAQQTGNTAVMLW